ncbi:MAG: metallopeptidase family protein [Planctomycetes bacterium]|nr:metallopeptidase family protein [Planctomycetota bacterium]
MPVHLPEREFRRIVDRAVEALPEGFRRYLSGLAIRVVDYPDDATMIDLGVRPPHYPFGLFTGPSIAEADGPRHDLPGAVEIYKRPLEEWCGTVEELRDQIERTLYHEIGHRLGFDEEDMPGELQGGAGLDVPRDAAAEAARHRRQAEHALRVADVLLREGANDWALGAALESAAYGMEAFLLARGVDPGEFSASSLEFLAARCADHDPWFEQAKRLDRHEQVDRGMGEEGMAPPCDRIRASDARDAALLAREIVRRAG